MKKRYIVTKLCLAIAGLAISTQSIGKTEATTFTRAQKAQFEQVIHDYILNNPQIISEANQKYQAQQLATSRVKANASAGGDPIRQNSETLFSDGQSPYAGNSNAQTVIVEFLDFQCGHCKQMHKVVQQALNNDKNLKVIYKIYPIFGEQSEYIARTALAAREAGKYKAFHDALLNFKGRVTHDDVNAIAKRLGFDPQSLSKQGYDKAVSQELRNTQRLARSLGVRGTPYFIVAHRPGSDNMKAEVITGSATTEELRQAIKAVRS